MLKHQSHLKSYLENGIYGKPKENVLSTKKYFAQKFPFLIVKNVYYLPHVKHEAHGIY